MTPVLTYAIATTVKVSAVLLVAGVLGRLLRRGSAASRHLIWSLAMGACVLIPLLSATSPFTIPILPAAAVASPAPDRGTVSPSVASNDQPPDEVEPVATPDGSIAAIDDARPLDRSTVIIVLWALGTLVLGIRFLAGISRIRAVVSQSFAGRRPGNVAGSARQR